MRKRFFTQEYNFTRGFLMRLLTVKTKTDTLLYIIFNSFFTVLLSIAQLDYVMSRKAIIHQKMQISRQIM